MKQYYVSDCGRIFFDCIIEHVAPVCGGGGASGQFSKMMKENSTAEVKELASSRWNVFRESRMLEVDACAGRSLTLPRRRATRFG